MDILPPTLLHGDVYGSNVIAGESPVLIDWGSARIGPALLDVTLAAGPTGLAAYERAWTNSTGTPPDPRQLAIGEAWSIAVNNAMFLGDVAQRAPNLALTMLNQAAQALTQLGHHLNR